MDAILINANRHHLLSSFLVLYLLSHERIIILQASLKTILQHTKPASQPPANMPEGTCKSPKDRDGARGQPERDGAGRDSDVRANQSSPVDGVEKARQKPSAEERQQARDPREGFELAPSPKEAADSPAQGSASAASRKMQDMEVFGDSGGKKRQRKKGDEDKEGITRETNDEGEEQELQNQNGVSADGEDASGSVGNGKKRREKGSDGNGRSSSDGGGMRSNEEGSPGEASRPLPADLCFGLVPCLQISDLLRHTRLRLMLPAFHSSPPSAVSFKFSLSPVRFHFISILVSFPFPGESEGGSEDGSGSEEGEDEDGQPRTLKRPRLVWTPQVRSCSALLQQPHHRA